MRVALAVASFAAGAHALAVDKNRPVSKVITLLKDMSKQLAKEQEQDEEIYAKMECWCKTNDKEKSQAIKDAEAKIATLTAEIEEGTAESSRLNAEIKNLEKEVAANEEALAKATAMRKKALAEFNAEEKDLLQSIQALKNAVVVLSKHNSKAFLQADAEINNINIASMLKRTMRVHKDVMEDALSPSQQETLKAFITSDAAPHLQAYANQSGEIFGILKQMQETFENNLSQSQKDELAAQAQYEELKAAKEAEIKAGQDQIDTKTQELADTDEKLANDKQDVEDTRNSLSADEQFLMMLKEKCSQTDAEWAARQKTRHDEIGAVNEALKVLSSDDAHDTFTRTFNFVQISSSSQEDARKNASEILSKAAKKNPKLMAIATSAKLDSFTRVKKAIDDMVAALTKEMEDEVKHKDYCVGAFNENETKTTHHSRNKADHESRIEVLTGEIAKLKDEIKDLQDQIAEATKQLKRAGEDREKQNAEFQATISDQRATQKLLNQALTVLKGYFEKKGATALLQQEPVGPPPPAGFNTYEKNAGGNPVIALITQIINDAKAMEAEATHDENDAQATYEGFVKETNRSNEEKSAEIVNKQGALATAEGDKVDEENGLANEETTLTQLANEKLDLHSSCDFVQKNFDIRQEARQQEIDALKQAKAILSGADLSR